jgi:hypothetical protein
MRTASASLCDSCPLIQALKPQVRGRAGGVRFSWINHRRVPRTGWPFPAPPALLEALGVHPGFRLRIVLARQDAISDRDAEFERDARQTCGRLVGNDFEMVGFAANNRTERNQRVVIIRLRQLLQRQW